jgi:hypothetical protein
VTSSAYIHPSRLQPWPTFSPSILQIRHQRVVLFRGFRRTEISLHRQRRPRALFNRTIDEAAPADRPVGVCEEDVALAGSEVLQAFGDEAGGGEEPGDMSVKWSGKVRIFVSLTRRPLRTRRLPSCGRPEREICQ